MRTLCLLVAFGLATMAIVVATPTASAAPQCVPPSPPFAYVLRVACFNDPNCPSPSGGNGIGIYTLGTHMGCI